MNHVLKPITETYRLTIEHDVVVRLLDDFGQFASCIDPPAVWIPKFKHDYEGNVQP